jgi:hypothetical protein
MNHRSIFGVIAVLILVPILFITYYRMNPVEPLRVFRGHEIAKVRESNGQVTVPTVEEDKNGATMHATFKPEILEKMSGVKSPNPEGVDFVVDSVDPLVRECTPEKRIPAKAPFDIARSCATTDFASWKSEKKGALFIDPLQKLIMFGAGGNNHMRIYHNDWIVTYISPDMTQTDRKKEVCIVRRMVDLLFGIAPDPQATCAVVP